MTGTSELDHRVGDAERQAATELLATHRDAGRLTAEEAEDRLAAVTDARTWSDVVPLFADLPAPYPAGMPEPATNAVAAQTSGGGGLSDVQRNAVVTVVALGATALAFIIGSWLPFLAIPVAGALLLWNRTDDKSKRPARVRNRRRG